MPLFGPPDVEKLKARADVSGLIKALRHKRWPIRSEAARALGDVLDARALEPLVAALRDENGSVREFAALALARLGDSRGLGPLVTLAHSSNPGPIRDQARRALGELDSPEARRALAEVSEREAASAAIDSLIEYSKEPFASEMKALMEKAVSQLRAAGSEGPRALAGFIRELLACRSPEIDVPLFAARHVDATGELLEAIHAVEAAPSTTQAFRVRRFPPEISGGSTIGWTDATLEKVRNIAHETLDALSSEGA